MQDDKIKNKVVNPHIPEEIWKAFADNTLLPADYHKLLEHTGSCTWCAERLSKIMEQGPMSILPPVYLKEQIRERTNSISVQRSVTVRRASRKMQMFWYSLKVSGAVAVSLVVLFLTGIMQRDIGVFSESADVDLWQEWESDRTETVEENAAGVFLSTVDQTANNVTDQISVFAVKLLNWNFVEDGGQ